MFLRVRTGVFLGGGTRVILGEGTGVAHGGGFPLGVVDLRPPIDASNRWVCWLYVPCLGEVCYL